MQRTRIKFCGITRIEDLHIAVDLGVDAIGLVFCPASPRAINVQQACTLIDLCGPFITCVGLFMDQDAVASVAMPDGGILILVNCSS